MVTKNKSRAGLMAAHLITLGVSLSAMSGLCLARDHELRSYPQSCSMQTQSHWDKESNWSKFRSKVKRSKLFMANCRDAEGVISNELGSLSDDYNAPMEGHYQRTLGENLSCFHVVISPEDLVCLAQAGQSVNLRDTTQGKTPLHLAVHYPHLCNEAWSNCSTDVDALRRLIYLFALGANPNLVDYRGETSAQLSLRLSDYKSNRSVLILALLFGWDFENIPSENLAEAKRVASDVALQLLAKGVSLPLKAPNVKLADDATLDAWIDQVNIVVSVLANELKLNA